MIDNLTTRDVTMHTGDGLGCAYVWVVVLGATDVLLDRQGNGAGV